MPDQAADVQRALAEAGFSRIEVPPDLHAMQRRVGASDVVLGAHSGAPITAWVEPLRVVVRSPGRPAAGLDMPSVVEAMRFADTLESLIGGPEAEAA